MVVVVVVVAGVVVVVVAVVVAVLVMIVVSCDGGDGGEHPHLRPKPPEPQTFFGTSTNAPLGTRASESGAAS